MCQGFFLGSAAVAAGHLVSADPRSGVWGSVEKGLVVGRRKRQGVVNKVAKASLGEGGWGPKRPTWVTGAPPGGVQSAAARSQIVGKAPKLEIDVFLKENVGS